MLRFVEQCVDGGLFDHPAHLHHDHPLGHLRHDAQVVGDEHDRHAQLALQCAHEAQDLRLGGHVERGGRLVGDQQVGPSGLQLLSIRATLEGHKRMQFTVDRETKRSYIELEELAKMDGVSFGSHYES